MNTKKLNIGESELEIMKVLWNSSSPITSVDIGNAVQAHGWKKTTIATFLTRLTEKGAITAKKDGKLYYYSPCITEDEYRKLRTGNLINNLYHGSVKELAVSLFRDKNLTPDDIEELRSMFFEKEE